MAKFVEITYKDFVWRVPAEVIAHNRAEYYKEDGYDAELKYTMESDFELRDWFMNNMDWVDVKDKAQLVKSPIQAAEPDLSEASLEVVEVEEDGK